MNSNEFDNVNVNIFSTQSEHGFKIIHITVFFYSEYTVIGFQNANFILKLMKDVFTFHIQ